jgi:hypothetical protein
VFSILAIQISLHAIDFTSLTTITKQMNSASQAEIVTSMDQRIMNPLRAVILLSATAVLLFATVVDSTATARANEFNRNDFVRKLKSIEEQHNIVSSDGIPKLLQQRIISMAQRVPIRKESVSSEESRRLNSYYNVYYNAKNKYINSYFSNDDLSTSSESSANDETASDGYTYNGGDYNSDKDSFYDDYYAFLDDDQYVEKANQYRKAESYDIDLTQMAMKYVGCQNVHSWQNGGGFTNRFVVFRLCEASACSYYNKWGCSYGYGQYILPLDTYLKLMAEFYFDDFSRYCTVCDDCAMFKDDDGDDKYECVLDEEYQVAAAQASASGDDNVQITEDDATDDASEASASSSSSSSSSNTAVGYNQYNSWYFQSSSSSSSSGSASSNSYSSNQNSNNNNGYYNYKNYGYYAKSNGNGRKLGNNYKSSNSTCPDGYIRQKKAYPWYIESNGKCAFSTVCNGYKKACTSHQTNASDYEDYFSCKSLNVGGTSRYIGPHCRSDGHTIGIGIYSDDQCSQYVGDTVDISEYTGLVFDDSVLQNYYEKSCITCDYGQSFVLVNDSDIGSEKYVNPMCEALFDVSAKCNKHISGATNDDANEEDVCSFIETTSKTRYDEMGDVIEAYSYSRVSTSMQMYWKSLQSATIVQWLFLCIALTITLLLLVYSCYLQKKLLFRKPWIPPMKVAAGATTRPSISNNNDGARSVATFNSGYSEKDLRQEAAWFSRVNSGIVLTRTDSYLGSVGPLGIMAATAGAGNPVDAPAVITTTGKIAFNNTLRSNASTSSYIPYGGSIPDRPPVSPGKQPPGRYAKSVASRTQGSSDEPPLGYSALKGTFS